MGSRKKASKKAPAKRKKTVVVDGDTLVRAILTRLDSLDNGLNTILDWQDWLTKRLSEQEDARSLLLEFYRAVDDAYNETKEEPAPGTVAARVKDFLGLTGGKGRRSVEAIRAQD